MNTQTITNAKNVMVIIARDLKRGNEMSGPNTFESNEKSFLTQNYNIILDSPTLSKAIKTLKHMDHLAGGDREIIDKLIKEFKNAETVR